MKCTEEGIVNSHPHERSETMSSASLHQRIHLAAESRPDAPAVVASDRTLTYEELEDRSGRLAGALRSSGCAPSDRVAVLMPSSPDTVIAELGVLRAGCAYVPLDPDAPVTRTAEIIRRTEPAVLLVADFPAGLLDGLRTRRMLADLPVGWLNGDEPPVDVAFTAADLDAVPARTGEPRGRPDDLACVVFTSDRRGSPRGVPVTHGSAGTFVDWAVDHFDLAPTDRVLGHPPSTLHLSAFDAFPALAAGAEIHQPSGRGLIHPHHDPAFLEARRITVWLSLPCRLSHVARFDGLDGHDLSSLRHLAWCGDAPRTVTLSYWKERLPSTTFTSLHGPVERVAIETDEDRGAPTAVEEAVMATDGVLDCAVVPLSAGSSRVKIGCAYIPEHGQPLRTDGLKACLADRLPAHMIPELWLVVEDLPVDDRGRIDRRLLRKMFGGEGGVDSVRPRPTAAVRGGGTSLRGA